MLALVGEPYELVDVDGFHRPGPARDRSGRVDALRQVPALVLANGMVLTETAAITLHLPDRLTGLAPERGSPKRDRFYRLLIWIVASIRPTFTYGDDPERPIAAVTTRNGW